MNMKTEPGSAAEQAGPRTRMLVIATLGFAVTFWAWALISPLAPSLATKLGLSSFQQSLIVAVPVIVGSLGRIPIGALTDRFGGRLMLPIVSVATIVPVLFLPFFGDQSLATLLIGGFFLGIGGTSFAVGVPFVSAWFPPERRGLAIGIFGVGMVGTAISAFTTVRLVELGSSATPFLVTAAALAVYAVVAWLLLRDAPGQVRPTTSMAKRVGETLKLGVTWQAAALYATLFGGYVAFSVYLPSLLKAEYDLSIADASNRMAGFVILAVIMRPVGGFLSDKIGPVPVLATCLGAVVFGALIDATSPALFPIATIAYLVMAAGLGAGSGATFALVALLSPAGKVGSVTGVVGAAGGLGGFVPPLLMGVVYGATGSYTIGFLLLALVAAAVLVFTLTSIRSVLAKRDAVEVQRKVTA